MKTVLVVDDELGLVQALCDVLEDNGYLADSAVNGQLALARLDERRPDLILLDVMMPVMDGPALMRALQARPDGKDIPLVVMSAAVGLPRASLPSVAGFLPKPFLIQELLDLVAGVIGPGQPVV